MAYDAILLLNCCTVMCSSVLPQTSYLNWADFGSRSEKENENAEK